MRLNTSETYPYYSKNEATGFGQFLHSAKMTLIHPKTKKELHFEAPLPKCFQDFLDKLDWTNYIAK